MAEIHTLPQPLDRLANKLRDYLTRDAANKEEWIAIQMGICVTLAEARAEFDERTEDAAFGEWCTDNGFAKDVISPQKRAAAIAMGNEPEALRKCLEATKRRSLEKIHRYEFDTFTRVRKGQDEPNKPSRRRKRASTPKIDAAREALRPRIEAGERINRHKLAETLGMSHLTVEAAQHRELGRLEGLDESQVDAVADRIVLSMTARQKVDAVVRRERATLAAEFAAIKAGQAEEVRQRVLKEGAEYLAYLNQERKEAYEQKEWYRRLINDHEPPFNETEFMSIWRCLHSDSRGSLSAARLDAAFALFNSRRLQLTGKK